MFFETTDDVWIPVVEIVDIGPEFSRGDRTVRSVNLKNGEAVLVGSFWAKRLTSYPIASFAAQPETHLLHVYAENGVNMMSSSPVVGWVVLADGSAYPVTPDGINNGESLDDPLPILTPDETVTIPLDRSWPSLTEFKQAKNVVDGILDLSALGFGPSVPVRS